MTNLPTPRPTDAVIDHAVTVANAAVLPAPDPLAAYPDFSAEVLRRLLVGRSEYGDKSFSADPVKLVRELRAEAMDLAGWGYVLWHRLDAMERAMSERTSGRSERARISWLDDVDRATVDGER